MWCPSSTSAKTPKTAMATETADESFRGDAKRRTRNLGISRCAIAHPGSVVFRTPRNDSELNLDLGSELDHLPRGHVEECRRPFGVALQKRKHRLPPHPHARNILAGNDGLAADVVGDIGEIDAGQFALRASELQTVENRRILH